jgi:hypothetical protein
MDDSGTQLGMLNPLNAKLNPIGYLLALLGAHRILHVSRIRVNEGKKECFMWATCLSTPLLAL